MRSSLSNPARWIVVAVMAVALLHSAGAYADDAKLSKPEDVVAQHLDSLGKAAVRSDAKTRVVKGTAHYQLLVGGAGNLDGTSVMASEGNKMVFVLKFASNTYRGEQIVTDGNKTRIATTTAQQTRSSFGEFLRVQDAIIREGLLGGELTTAWAFLHLDDHKPKLKFEGLQNVDGVKLYDLRYQPKKNSDLDIHVYFDPETFHHVRTVYKLTIKPGLGHVDNQVGDANQGLPGAPPPGGGGLLLPGESSETTTARQQETRYRIDESFGDFRSQDGLTLPTTYKLHFSQEFQNGQTQVSEWEVKGTEFDNNIPLDPKNFEVK